MIILSEIHMMYWLIISTISIKF